LKLAVSFEVLNLDDECIAVPVGDDSQQLQGVLKLNEEGAAIVRLLAEDTTEDQIAEALMKEYDATKEELLSEIHTFVETLRSNNLITE